MSFGNVWEKVSPYFKIEGAELPPLASKFDNSGKALINAKRATNGFVTNVAVPVHTVLNFPHADLNVKFEGNFTGEESKQWTPKKGEAKLSKKLALDWGKLNGSVSATFKGEDLEYSGTAGVAFKKFTIGHMVDLAYNHTKKELKGGLAAALNKHIFVGVTGQMTQKEEARSYVFGLGVKFCPWKELQFYGNTTCATGGEKTYKGTICKEYGKQLFAIAHEFKKGVHSTNVGFMKKLKSGSQLKASIAKNFDFATSYTMQFLETKITVDACANFSTKTHTFGIKFSTDMK